MNEFSSGTSKSTFIKALGKKKPVQVSLWPKLLLLGNTEDGGRQKVFVVEFMTLL